jgi:hypothetical protein
MTIEQLRKMHRASPFRPLQIHLADGREIDVPHPKFLYVPPKTDRTFIVTDDRGLADIVDLLLVVSLKQLNGEHRRRKSA